MLAATRHAPLAPSCLCPGCTLAVATGDLLYAPLGHASLAGALLHLHDLETRGDGLPWPGTDAYQATAEMVSLDSYRDEVLGVPSIWGGGR